MAIANGYSYGINLLISIDQTLNAILGGSCDETLSSRTYRMGKSSKLWGMFEALIDTIFWRDIGPRGERHCELAFMVESRLGHMPKAVALKMVKTCKS